MAKKSNKTEHVLKLITMNDEADQDDLFGLPEELAGKGSTAAAVPKPDKPSKADKPAKEKASKAREPEVKEAEPKIKPAEPEAKQTEPEIKPVIPETKPTRPQAKPADPDLINIPETLVREKIDLVMERMKVCTCRTCVNDVMALALNSLPTKYIATDAGRQYFQMETYKKQYETDILAALTKACVRVKAAPRHVKE